MPRRLDETVAAQEQITRSQARALIMEGRVKVNGSRAAKAGANVAAGAVVEVESPRRFVSRGGEKLEHALDAFALDASGKETLDVGASTGGFTDCLLQRGAKHVTSVDVGYGQLDWRLRNDPRVTVLERANFRNLPDQAFERAFELIAIDTSFISLKTIVERAVAYLAPKGDIVALVKPQFEAGRKRIGKGGVVRDPAVHRAILHEIRGALAQFGLAAVGLTPSPLLGPAGNREFLMHIRRSGPAIDDGVIEAVLSEPMLS